MMSVIQRLRLSSQNLSYLKRKCIPSSYNGEVEAHYPFYKLKMENSTFLFDHGHLFSSLLNRLAGSAGSIEEIEKDLRVHGCPLV